MMDFLGGVEMSLEQAACIAQAMWQVAEAEHGVHAHEQEMIESFFKGCAADAGQPDAIFDRTPFDATRALALLDTEELKANLLRSCLLVGYADGHCSPVERSVIDGIAESLQLPADLRETVDRTIQRELLSQFEGLDVFKSAVYEMGQQLGLSADDVDQLIQEH